MDTALMNALAKVARPVAFEDGTALRMKGVFASDILLITDGVVECILSEKNDVHLQVGAGDIVGEIGFLTGKGANATLRAVGPVSALSIDGSALGRLQRDDPQHAAQVLRHLAILMQDRVEENEILLPDPDPSEERSFDIIRCSTLDQLRTTQKIRYDIYCLEFGRSSPYADPDEGTIIDDLDKSGTSFLALHDGVPVGTVRINLGRDSDFGPMTDIYGVKESAFDLEDASIVTKFAIREAYRGGSAYMRLFSAIAGFVHTTGARSIFIDCNPKLARFYATMGFVRSAPDFVHYENGLSVPMVLDLQEYFGRMPLEDRVRRNRWR
ncbi:GNAT family N-acetyltransferase [Gymnodinialimonas hymeniacidonis]|uniref:GNAT family N-acetyltransferase n=1 Tax=Gymnodinialimonas hymeniacidonis TaxID=3126508 RepID=UPI0034C644CF